MTARQPGRQDEGKRRMRYGEIVELEKADGGVRGARMPSASSTG
jgi:hypothetical protein